MEIITGEARRQRSDAEKLIVLADAEALGSVTKAARRHGVNPSMVYTWRKLFRERRQKPALAMFAPVHLAAGSLPGAPPMPISPVPEDRGVISVSLGALITLTVPRDADPALAAAITAALAPFAAGRS